MTVIREFSGWAFHSGHRPYKISKCTILCVSIESLRFRHAPTKSVLTNDNALYMCFGLCDNAAAQQTHYIMLIHIHIFAYKYICTYIMYIMYIIIESEMPLKFKFVRWTFFFIPTLFIDKRHSLHMIFERGVKDWGESLKPKRVFIRHSY